jgi:glutathione synthase/RimK-type ligase-like ATP-grasp enzyme
MAKTLIVIGDPMMSLKRLEPSLDRFMGCRQLLSSRGIRMIFITYDDASYRRLPAVSTRKIDVLLFFPFNHWNNHIERYDRDSRIYGDTSFGIDFKNYLKDIARTIRSRYADKSLSFINSPEACINDRDKLKTSAILRQAGIKSPEIFKVCTAAGFRKLLSTQGALYVKPRFGAMGKGITYASLSGVYTNFHLKSKKIAHRMYDYNWRPVRVPDKHCDNFIETLISRGFIFQKAIEPLVLKARKFDVRVYVVLKKTPYLYAKSAPEKSFITNWSQGGRIEKKPFLNSALSEAETENIKSMSIKAAKAIGLSFAGIDIIIDRHTRVINVLEIQSFPGYERGFDLMKSLAKGI